MSVFLLASIFGGTCGMKAASKARIPLLLRKVYS